jgi:ferredoxin
MRVNAVRFGGDSVETVHRNGREYLKFPMIPMREMVLNYPEDGQKEYLSAETIRESEDRWNGVALLTEHPNSHGNSSQVNTSSTFTNNEIGKLFNPETLGNGEKLKGEAWIDVEKAEAIGGTAERVVADLRVNNEVEVSAGYGLGETGTGGRFNGTQYDLEQQELYPDHIAIFPKDEFTARCSPEDGCAAPRANTVNMNTENQQTQAWVGRRVMNALGIGNSECDGNCDCEECTMPVENTETEQVENTTETMNEPTESTPDDTLSRDEIRTLVTETVQDVLDEQSERENAEPDEEDERPQMNYGAIPGPDNSGSGEYPGGRADWEQRRNAGETGPTVQNPNNRTTPSWEKPAEME